ncbi:MAG: CusA/CzcA family heavy metal efflux RND transporter, partial [Bacteroidetes bacterium]|nr:CusA/CzcA family heavy metal efflux RND transporter [Bacteroidota bacterium]
MIDRIILLSVKNKLTISALTLLLIGWGTYSLSMLPVDAVPDVTSNQVDVITNSPSLATLEIERFITAPLEMAMSNIPGLVEVRSVSKFGLSVVKLVFSDDTDLYWARQQVFERLEAVKSEIPEELGKPAMGPVSTGLGEVFQYVIRPKDPADKSFSLMEIRTLQDWFIRKQLLGIKGVAEVSGFGGYKKEYQASINPERLRGLHVTIDELFAALESGNSNTGGAYVEKDSKAYTIRGLGLATTLEEVGNTVIKVNNNVPVLVKDVVDISFGHSIRYGAITVDGEGEAVGGIIMMVKGENGNALIQRLKARMKIIQARLPKGLIIEPFIDREKIVNKAIKTVSTNLIEGAVIVMLVIVVFLGDFRASLLAASVIPLSMLFAFGFMIQFDVIGNLMSLGAIDFGLLVDPSIIIIEAIVLSLAVEMAARPKGDVVSQLEKEKLIIKATQGAKRSVVFGGLIILIVYFPILTLTGIEGKMFAPMAKTVSFAILGALVLSVTYVPMMGSIILEPPRKPHAGLPEKIVSTLFGWYEPALRYGLQYKGRMIMLALLILGAGVIGFRNIGGEFIPKLAEGDLVIETNLPVGTAMTQTIALSEKIQKMLLTEYPDEVERVVSKIGTSEVPVDPMPMEAQEIVVVLKDKEVWKKAKEQDELVELIAKKLEQYPGIVNSIQQPIENRVNELMSGARTDVVVKVFGPNLDTMVNKGNQIIKLIKGVDGAADVQENKVYGLPQINIQYDRRALAVYGVTVKQVNRAIQTAFAGAVAGIIYENDKRFDLTLRLSSEERSKMENIQNLQVNDIDGHPIPLKQLATITEEIGPSEIGRENLQRRMNIGFNVRGRDLESVVNDVMKVINDNVLLSSGYNIEIGGEFENYRRALDRLSIVVPISLLIIFGLLYATFGNMKDSLLIYTVVPLSAVGGVFSLLLRGMNFSISAGVGFIALFGIAVLNGILLVNRFNELAGLHDNMTDRIVTGLRDRFRPVLMTSAVAALGFVPMAISHGAGAEVQRPLATVVIGGLFTSTILTLLVLPVLYAIFKRSNRSTKKVSYTAVGVVVIGMMMLPSSGANAQKLLPPDSAVKVAKIRNPEMKLAGEKIDQQKALKSGTFSLPSPELIFEAPTGHDLRPGILQLVDYPGVYAFQRQAQENRIVMSETERKITTNNLVYRVLSSYNQLQYLIARTSLLRSLDSVFDDILRVNDVRYRVGQISNLERINGESQYKRIQFNLKQSIAELRSA